jgi:alpha-tubulin suppressor-like RCC1 family protein
VAVLQPAGVAFAVIRAGGFHSCAATAAGQAYCWGRNLQGELGDSTTTSRPAPVAVKQPSGVLLPVLAAGYLHTCGVTSAGQAWCWGRNLSGQLGNNATVNRKFPVQVQQGGALFTGIVAGIDHTCALGSAGALWCWGGNDRNQLGDGTTTGRLTPVAVQQPAGATFTAITAGLVFNCAIRGGGQGYCWGGNYNGQVGDSTQVDHAVPVPTWH